MCCFFVYLINLKSEFYMKVRLDYLDSIRGVAALLVVFHHTFEVFLKQSETDYPVVADLLNSINLGRLGVIVFFMTSGFVIPWSLKPRVPSALIKFIIKRFFRLYPAYWFSIVAAVALGFGYGTNIISDYQVLLNFTMIHKFLGVESVIASYWTLHLELVFYAVCASLFYLGRLQKNKYLIILTVLFCCCAVFFAAIRYYYQIKIPIIMPLGLAVMFYGAVFRNYLLEKQTELRMPLILLTTFYFTSLFMAQKMYYLDGWLAWFVTHLAAFSLFFILVTRVKLTNLFAVYLGRISYSLYLLHSLVIGLVFYLFSDFSYSESGFVLVTLCVVVGSIFIADLSFRFIEKPGLGLARRVMVKIKI